MTQWLANVADALIVCVDPLASGYIVWPDVGGHVFFDGDDSLFDGDVGLLLIVT